MLLTMQVSAPSLELYLPSKTARGSQASIDRSSSVPRSSAKRAKSAIEASTMRSARETTHVRRRNRASQCRCRAWSRSIPWVSSLPTWSPALRDQLGVRRPIIGTVEADAPALQSFGQPLAGGLVTTAQLPVEEPSRSTIPSLPHPELVGLFFRKCHISSSSTTTARPSGSGFCAYTSAKRSIQACTLGVETPSSLAVRFIDRPLRYSSTASTLTRSGMPRGGVSVKFSPQALHK